MWGAFSIESKVISMNPVFVHLLFATAIYFGVLLITGFLLMIRDDVNNGDAWVRGLVLAVVLTSVYLLSDVISAKVFVHLLFAAAIFLGVQFGIVFALMLTDEPDNKKNLSDKVKWRFGFRLAVLLTVFTFPIWLQ